MCKSYKRVHDTGTWKKQAKGYHEHSRDLKKNNSVKTMVGVDTFHKQ
jgi:hypothetical protein